MHRDQRARSTALGSIDGGVAIPRGDAKEEGFPEGVDVVIVVGHLISGVVGVHKEALGNLNPALGNPLIRYVGEQ